MSRDEDPDDLEDLHPGEVLGVVLAVLGLAGFGFVAGIAFAATHPVGRDLARNLTNPNVTTGPTAGEPLPLAPVAGVLAVVLVLGLALRGLQVLAHDPADDPADEDEEGPS